MHKSPMYQLMLFIGLFLLYNVPYCETVLFFSTTIRGTISSVPITRVAPRLRAFTRLPMPSAICSERKSAKTASMVRAVDCLKTVNTPTITMGKETLF